MNSNIKNILKEIGLPRLIISGFLIFILLLGSFFKVSITSSLNDIIVRFGMNAILVLSLIPMIRAGCGLNFGIPVGIIGGILGGIFSLDMLYNKGLVGLATAVLFAIFFGTIIGLLYGLLLNKVKGDEMLIATYVGYFSISFMNMIWLTMKLRNPASMQGFKGEGLRSTVSVEDYWAKYISKFLQIKISDNFIIPTGMILVFALLSFILWIIFKTKLGTDIIAVGANEEFAKASGININKIRLIATVLSTVIAAVGIIVYQQQFGFIQAYNAPAAFVFPTVSAILIGGATVKKASILNVLIGTLLFQGVLTLTPSVINSIIQIDVSEIIRIIISNGLIVYALTRREEA